ncbi:DegV family protein [Conexibacter sp. DBS9H8]|uniref:DegV family protein n=1 Tax=Conexibacter sp. DBS9H8 TaxID=2937801 RepID=UPI00200D6146|nr:DegV family protein [Conexibacter sp. DBS9H8]
MPITVVTDTCAYLPPEVIEQFNIAVVSLYVHIGGEAIREADITDYGDYFRRLGSASELPTTSQPSIGDFLAVYEPLIDAGHEIVSLHLAGGMSGTVHTAEQARQQLGGAADRVRVIDTHVAGGAQGLMVQTAAKTIERGGDLDAVVSRVREVHAAMRFWFVVDTLEYLRRGGRIGGAQAWLGTALKIKPILSVAEEITPVERVRTTKRAFDRLVALLEQTRADGADGWAVQHIQAPEYADALVERGRAIFGREPLFVSEIGPVIGTHVGPGLIGAGAIPTALVT